MDIAEVVAQSGVPASTLRYYEERRLISSTGRRGLRRQFDPSVLQRLALIALCRTAGFSLAEITGMVAADGELRIDRQALAGRADALDRTIRELTVLSEGLRHAAACPASSHAACPTFHRRLR